MKGHDLSCAIANGGLQLPLGILFNISQTLNMKLRKLLNFSGTLGITIPKIYTNAMGVSRGDYAEIYLRDRKTLVVKKHEMKGKTITAQD